MTHTVQPIGNIIFLVDVFEIRLLDISLSTKLNNFTSRFFFLVNYDFPIQKKHQLQIYDFMRIGPKVYGQRVLFYRLYNYLIDFFFYN